MRVFLSLLLSRGGISKNEYNMLVSSCHENSLISDFQEALENVVKEKHLESENKQAALQFLIDINLDMKNYEVVKSLSEELREMNLK